LGRNPRQITESRLRGLTVNRYFPVACPKCGWEGSSEHVEGGGQIADTGDYDDMFCPDCFKKGELVIVDED